VSRAKYGQLFTVDTDQGALALKVGDTAFGGFLYLYKLATGSKVSNLTVPVGAWAFVLAKFDGATITLRINAQRWTGANTAMQIPNGLYTTGEVTARPIEGEPLYMAQRRLFNRAVTQQEEDELYADQGLPQPMFPPITRRSMPGSTLSYNPHPIPVPNPTAIPRSGRSTEQGSVVRTLGHFDQRDGSGGSHLSPSGVVSQPDRQGRLSGNTTGPDGSPVSRRVRCFERKSGRIVRETWSNAAGYYQFDDLDPNKRFTVVSHDHTGEYNAVIADNTQPEVPA